MANEDENIPEQDHAASEGRLPMAGQRLAEARHARNVTIAEIAKQLHIDEHKVQALEENQFEVLGAPVFAKGHLRKYAELLGVPIDDVLTDYYKLNRSTGAPPLVARARPSQRDMSLGPWLIWLAILAVLGLAVFAWMSWDRTPELVQTPGLLEPFVNNDAVEDAGDDDSATAGQQTAPLAGTETPDSAAPDATAASNAPVPGSDTPPATTSAANDSSGAVAASTLTAGQVSIVMLFSGECWTEVTDADGRRLYFGLGEAGRTVSRTGKAPLQALFGDRNNVSVTVNGSPVELRGDGRRGNTARVTIGAP